MSVVMIAPRASVQDGLQSGRVFEQPALVE